MCANVFVSWKCHTLVCSIGHSISMERIINGAFIFSFVNISKMHYDAGPYIQELHEANVCFLAFLS